ncbi:MAG: transaldolase, partial [Deltaproteobacteria bacterium]|nr:transaldolase [Deltaproteobacteria bacterium]
PTLPVSFEVLDASMDGMEREARVIHSWGRNVYVKIPVIDPAGNSMEPLIRRLSEEGVPVNVTCVFTTEQAEIAARALHPDTPSIVSVFAGRVADVGIDPSPLVRECREIVRPLPKSELLWASTREVFNIWQAAEAGCRIITVPPAMAAKLRHVGKTPLELSIDAVNAFMRDTAGANVAFSAR